MRLVRCQRSSSRVLQEARCICHGQPHRIEALHADLDGPAFRAYYCAHALATRPDGSLTVLPHLIGI